MSFLLDKLVDYLPKLLIAVVILVVGIILVRLICSFTRKALCRSKLDPTLHSFLVSILTAVLYIILGITVVGALGVPIGSLITLLGVSAWPFRLP